ncbi:MAG: hypothetical protein E7171_06055 [Firmicutes bacterium]|nr:hypothetical protein [Bacillota bacterium]
MARYRNDKNETLSATQIVDRFGIGYYELQIGWLQSRISNIRSGNGDCADGVVYESKDSLKTSRDRERAIDKLRKKIEDHKKIIAEINEAIRTVNHGMIVLRKAEETHALIGALSDDLRYCFRKFTTNEKTGERYPIPSDTYDAIFVNKMFENAKSKYRRLWSKEYKKTNAQTRKVKKDIYKKLKKVSGRRMVDMGDDYGYGHSRDIYDYSGLNFTLKENNKSLKGFGDSLAADMRSELDYWDRENLSTLGVEVDKIKRAHDISDGEERLFDEFGPILKSMEYLASEYSIQKRFKTFYFLREDIKEVDKLSREVECLDLIIDAYDNSAIKDTDLFKELVEIYRKQNKKLNNLTRKVREVYQRSGMKEYIEIEQKLRDLHHKAGGLRYQLSISEERLGYSDPETRKLNDMYFGARSEMLSIVLKYPELNRPEYGIDLTKYDKKGRYIGEEPEHKQIPENSGKPVKVEEEEPFVPTVVVTEEELRRDLGIEDETPKQNPRKAWEVADESPVDENNFEIPENLTSMRTAYYSRYMVEKVKGSELGKMKFSEYLENVAPELEELIEIEKRRENRAKNVFKLYVQYLASLEDKSQAMRFSEFARLRHGLNEDDLPYEYTDEEVKKRLSL